MRCNPGSRFLGRRCLLRRWKPCFGRDFTGLENPAENFWNIIAWLGAHGYSDVDIQKVIGGNAMRVLREVW